MSGKTMALCLGAMLLLIQLPALALNGRADSPGSPTAVLPLLGAASGDLHYGLGRYCAGRKAENGSRDTQETHP